MMAQAVGADSTAVYLAESLTEQTRPKLIPVAIYPPDTDPFPRPDPQSGKALPGNAPSSAPPSAAAPTEVAGAASVPAEISASPRSPLPSWMTARSQKSTAQQLAIPLMHEGGVLGILVSWRADRPWQADERYQMEEYARSLALACVLDQRGQWLKTQLSALDRVQAQQSDRFHELLHQLRSPLTALKTFGKLLTKRLSSEDRNQSLVSNMLRESDRMQELLGYFDDTLKAADDSRDETANTRPLLAPAAENTTLEAQATPAEVGSLSHFGGALMIRPQSVASLVEPLVASTRTLAEEADRQFHVFPPVSQAVTVKADAKALVEILSNFLDNALKYSTPGTHIWLQWGFQHSTVPHLVGILVGDTGPGIPEGDQPHIFERKYRGVQASGTLDGSGLGLAIAADLVQEMQGEIAVYSPLQKFPWQLPERLSFTPIDRGTAFVIWLPQADA